MNIIVVDDEKIAMEGLVAAIQKAQPEAIVEGFRNAQNALNHVQLHNCDVAFLDIEMREMDGITLARKIRSYNDQVNIIFATGYGEYAAEAFQLHASGYLMKPVTPEQICNELENLRHPIMQETCKPMRVQTFGNFEVFLHGVPAKFQYTKTKEMLAYLIDRRGSLCTNGEIIGVLWEDDGNAENRASYLKNIRSDLKRILKEAECDEVLIAQRGKIGIAPDKIACDYYDWLDGKVYAINAYHGEYMNQYSWSEYTNSNLMNLDY